jgi:hypothetical protein
VNVVTTLATQTIVLGKAIISSSGVECVCALFELEPAISLAEAKATLVGQDETDLRVQVGNVELAVHRGKQGLLCIDICEVERERTCRVVLKANLLET